MDRQLCETHIRPSYVAQEIMTFIKKSGGVTNEMTITVLIITSFLADFNSDTWGIFDFSHMRKSLKETSATLQEEESKNPSLPRRSPAFTTLDIEKSIRVIVEDGHLETVAFSNIEKELYRTTDSFPKWCLSEIARLSCLSSKGDSIQPLS